jgi:hypothetical protein
VVATAPYRIESVHRIGGATARTDNFSSEPDDSNKNWETGGAKSLSVPGELHIDEYVLWPAKAEVAIGDYAESWPVEKKLSYDVQADGKSLASGTFGAWILGSGSVGVDVSNAKVLRLAVTTTRGRNIKKTIFWTNAKLFTADNQEILLSSLGSRIHTDNISQPPKPGLDYEGGPIRVAGMPLTAETSMPGEPDEAAHAGVITVDLTDLGAVRFEAGVGGDWPVGNEEQLRKTVAVRLRGTTASFVTLLEPFESKSMIKSASAQDSDHIRIELNDGRTQDISLSGLDADAGDVRVNLQESGIGHVSRSESAVGVAN